MALARLRDALLNLPTLPLRLWLIGIVSLVAVYVGGAIRFRRRLRRAAPAPNAVQRMVVRTARQFELRRAPETLVLDEPISPMVWCGGRVRLVLPAGLWSQLDEVGRQAIVCHELAHLRRRDHWLRWLELLVSVVFWWHPLVWWVRRRVHEEADLCCDAWVTWLMPRRRRAYAEALLAAREHMGAGRRLTPAVAVGVTTSGAKRFARRITMVMTQSSRPGVSLAGIGLAGALLLAGWITTPAWSSPPPDERAVDCKTVVVKGEAASDCCQKSGQKCDTQCRVIVLGGDAAGESEQKCGERKVIVKKLGEEGDDGPFSVFYSMASGDDEDETRYFLQQLGGSDDDELEQRLERLEKAVQQLTELLGGEAVDVDVPAPPAPPCPPAPPGLLKSYTWRTPEGKTFKIGDDEVSIAIGTPWVSVDTGETVVKAYKLPQGKLEALTALMVRQDVPVLVSPKEDCIEVHGTEAQHKIFKAFVDLINPAGKESSAKGEAAPQASIIINGTDLSDLLKSRVDADVLLQHGDKAERQKALDLYRKALSQMGKYQITVPGGDLKVIKELDEESAEQAEQMRKEAQQLRQQAEELREQVEAYQSKTQPGQDELLHAVRELQKEAKKLQKLAEQLSKQAEHEHE